MDINEFAKPDEIPSLTVQVIKDITETSRYKSNPRFAPNIYQNGGNLGLVLKMKNIACISILLTKHVKYTCLYLFKFVLYSTVAFKAN